MKLKKLPNLQFVITDQMSLLSPLNSNDRSIPLNVLSTELQNCTTFYYIINTVNFSELTFTQTAASRIAVYTKVSKKLILGVDKKNN